ncbi:DNA-binding protein YbaB [Mycolicibacterium sp. BK556]|uniref:hypothetical protein n=1 Tax=unclassified Mycolicibacterium TaxID=2636767 RepID=UPI00162070AF|nr:MULTISPECIES: hypothetical protein [unclassified Mycolicibacterium]MBB3606367.1 DNA-binding protein YbaB [Mycolicibacterium sp. BK556]MBB3636387.1 DNA-binding protein YbaB [Mycolicibacterium sp. BK607]
MTAEIEDRTYVEASRDGAVMVELDRHGYALRVQLEPQVNADWTAELLGERLVRLYTAALMRARCDERAQMNERGADMAPTPIYPDADEVAAYRARYLDF